MRNGLKRRMLAIALLLTMVATAGVGEETNAAQRTDAMQQAAQVQATFDVLPYKLGDSGKHIQDIQGGLFVAGYTTELLGDGRADWRGGTFDERTQKAVRAFQQDRCLPQTGEVDAVTLEAILPGYMERQAAAAAGALVLGSQGQDVKHMQEDMKLLDIYDGEVTGNFGSITEQAVRTFQQTHGLIANGCADAKTQSLIRSEAEKMQL